MPQDTITFQLATHFLPKIALRLECLYQTIDQACQETHPVIHHYALKNIIEIIKLIEKPELKSRFLKELMRIEHSINKSNTIIASELYDNLYTQIQSLTHTAGLFGEGIHQNPFLQSIRLTQPTQSNDCEMYSPQLLLWLESNPGERQRDLAIWLNHLRTLQATVTIYLRLLRDTAQFDEIDLFSGFYQRALPPKTSCHLILLRIDKTFGIVPRMQLGHHGLSLRLCEASTMREIRETHARLDLGICQI
ncbi:cell division protein ZapD [Legionella taurinensis]|uniref:Cell division protein ZapD n=1 Tax=Legionella taurinensis TaxID=70611 RepID=A0A3A5L2R1_9GAMM|nr:cell division protein ZapD [Legionella taurinensis]MDX1838300.1 cell division protein ZapD [Legionella taurinensis]PUT39212.1 cell division protein ZapD [Legionella taurinensis]PUT39519.1 cell division protein ZapD [Legionella taurinensis]PUT43978.1 cell division protein ZapD [Legionella taurinensis]PUT45022.1 cell division protein ZapD [Legionella taurinensis]